MCKSTARSALQQLTDLELLGVEVKKGFRLTEKEYTLTEKGHSLGKIIRLVNDKLCVLLKERHK